MIDPFWPIIIASLTGVVYFAWRVKQNNTCPHTWVERDMCPRCGEIPKWIAERIPGCYNPMTGGYPPDGIELCDECGLNREDALTVQQCCECDEVKT